MQIEERIQMIMQKMKKLNEKQPQYDIGLFPPQWNPPVSEEMVANFEMQNGIQLPEDYKKFLITVADGGTQPFYGLYALFGENDIDAESKPVLQKKFPYTVKNPLYLIDLSEEEYDEIYSSDTIFDEIDAGFLWLCHEGCAMYSILIVNTEDPETYGTVWFYDFANDVGTAPLMDPKTKKPMHFLDWLEYYVDTTLALEEDDYFSYIDLMGKVEG